MNKSRLNKLLDEAAAEVSGSAGRSLYARVNAWSVFESRGIPIDERPPFSSDLPRQAGERAHDYLLLALKHLHNADADERTDKVLEAAGELLEKLYSEFSDSPERARGIYNAALAYYLSGHYARAYVIMQGLDDFPDTPGPSHLLRLIFLKNIQQMRDMTTTLLLQRGYSDVGIANALTQGEIGELEAVDRILEATINRAVSLFIEHARSGREELIARSLTLLEAGIGFAIDQEIPEWWWLLYCARAMLREYRRSSFWTVFRPMLDEDDSGLVRNYIQGAFQHPRPAIEMWRSQIQAFEHMNDPERQSYCIRMPTSAGKTRIAESAILRFLLDDPDSEEKCLYIAPYRALAIELEESLAQSFGTIGIRVSELYGGFDLNPAELQLFEETRILIATPEKTDAFLRYKPELADQIGLIIIDEGHIIDASSRGLRYEIFLHRVVRRFGDRGVRLLFISAVMPSADEFAMWITGQEAEKGLITSEWRASQLFLGVLTWDGQAGRVDYLYRGLEPIDGPMFISRFMTAFPTQQLRDSGADRHAFPRRRRKYEVAALAALEAIQDGPALIFASQPGYVESVAKAVLKALSLRAILAESRGVEPEGLPGPDNPSDIRRLEGCIRLAEETTGQDSLIVQALRAGFVFHHGEIPKPLRVQIESLARRRIVSLTIATNTLAQGVNLPVKTILIHSLVQGPNRIVPSTDFWNICGRAGRAMSENEGLILLIADETQQTRARERSEYRLQEYVRDGRSQSLVSALKGFLGRVLQNWSSTYPHASLANLCEHLAENQIEWLSEKDQHLLEILDSQLLALLVETETTEITPDLVEELFERSMLFLQLAEAMPGETLTVSVAVDMLVSRIEHIRRMTAQPKRRRQYYRMGLALSDCQFIQENQRQIEEVLEQAAEYDNWTPEECSDYLVDLCEKYLMTLSDVRPDDTADLPACWTQILRQWLLGKNSSEIFQEQTVAAELESAMRVSAVIDDLCDYRLPWGFNALYSFLEVEREQELIIDDEVVRISDPLPMVAHYFPAMIRHGVYLPRATLLMTIGLDSRKAALSTAERYSGPLDTSSLLRWIIDLTEAEIEQWNMNPAVQADVAEFVERTQERHSLTLATSHGPLVFQMQMPERPHLSPLVDGTTLILQSTSPRQFSVYSPAIEFLGTLEIEDEFICELIRAGKVTASVQGSPEANENGRLEVRVAVIRTWR